MARGLLILQPASSPSCAATVLHCCRECGVVGFYYIDIRESAGEVKFRALKLIKRRDEFSGARKSFGIALITEGGKRGYAG